MEVFQLLDNNPLRGHYRVKVALDSLGGIGTATRRLADGRPLQTDTSAREAGDTPPQSRQMSTTMIYTHVLNRPGLAVKSTVDA
jgi:hypothetical protein